jgi:hypothetical protein
MFKFGEDIFLISSNWGVSKTALSQQHCIDAIDDSAKNIQQNLVWGGYNN